jgi:NAD(P) transhydrogenase
MVAAQAPYCKNVVLIDSPTASGRLMAGSQDLSIGAPTGLFSKALRDTSKRINVATLRGMGLREDSVWNEIISNCVELAASNANDIVRQLEAAGVEYKQGFCSFADDDYKGSRGSSAPSTRPHSLFITNGDKIQTVMATKVLVATGSKPFRPSGIPFDGVRIFDSDSINSMGFLPRSIAITGSGIIAVEFAKIFRNLGAHVTLIIRDNVPRNALMKIGLDKDVAATLVADLVRSGIKIERGKQVQRFEVPDQPRAPIKIFLEPVSGATNSDIVELKCDAYIARRSDASPTLPP